MKNGIAFYGISLLLGFTLFSSCKKSQEETPGTKVRFTGYDVILIIGQSNTHQGIGIDSLLDAPDPEVVQLGRWDSNNLKIILAKDPMDHLYVEKKYDWFRVDICKAL